MREALVQARKSLGRTFPNPSVGAVIYRGGEILGRGRTRPPPGAHAEVTKSGSVQLTEGPHAIKVIFTQGGGGAGLMRARKRLVRKDPTPLLRRQRGTTPLSYVVRGATPFSSRKKRERVLSLFSTRKTL